MYNKILVPVLFDAEHQPTQSLEAAQVLADEGATIILIHVIEEIPSYATNYLPDNHMETAVENAHVALQKIAATVPGGTATVVRGHAARTILDFSDANGIDCIVITSHKPGLQDYLLGGTAARVVRHGQCSVHVIR